MEIWGKDAEFALHGTPERTDFWSAPAPGACEDGGRGDPLTRPVQRGRWVQGAEGLLLFLARPRPAESCSPAGSLLYTQEPLERVVASATQVAQQESAAVGEHERSQGVDIFLPHIEEHGH